jgi:hypothetical protein
MPNTQESPKALDKERTDEETANEDTLYCSLQKIGIYNITTLMKRLEIPSSTEPTPTQPSQEANTHEKKISEPHSNSKGKIRENSLQLLKLMGLSQDGACADLLEKICLQGKEMLGEISKPTIASAHISGQTFENGYSDEGSDQEEASEPTAP